MSPSDLWQLIHDAYGEELGLTTDDEDEYVPPTRPGGEGLILEEERDDNEPEKVGPG